MIPEDFKPKSFWQKPEGTMGMIFGVAVGGGILYGLYKLLPYIITLLENVIYATFLGVALFVLIWVLSDRRFWMLGSYMYKSIMRVITGLFITIDPIGILKNYILDLKKSLERMYENINNLRGRMEELKNLIDANKKKIGNALRLAKEAQDKNKREVLVLKSREAGRLKESNMTLEGLYTKMEVLYRFLKKMYETSEILLQDMESEVDVKGRERKAIQAAHSAFKSAMKIIKGDTDQKELFNQTMEYLAADYASKLGEIENFVEMSGTFIDSVDLQNGVYENEAMKMLEEWEKKSDSILLGEQKKLLLAEAYDPDNIVDLSPLPESVSVEAKEGKKEINYGKLFNN